MARLKGSDGKPISFTPPIDEVKESLTTVAPYSERVLRSQAKTDSLKGKGKPLGGAPPIPPGRMDELTRPQPDFGEPEPEPGPAPEPIKKPLPVGGVGSAYKVNQQLASGEFDGPVSMAAAKKHKSQTKLSPETVEALKQMDQTVKNAEPVEPVEPVEEATTPVALEIPERETNDKEELERADQELGRASFDIQGLVRARNSLLSEERRKKIEERLDKLDIADMVTKREVQQRVPVVPGRLDFTFRTMNQAENLFCLQYAYEFLGSEAYSQEILNTSKLVCSIVKINDAVLHNHLGEGGREVDRDEFLKKWDQVISFPTQLVGDMSVQLIWFSNRINDLFDVGHLKNG